MNANATPLDGGEQPENSTEPADGTTTPDRSASDAAPVPIGARNAFPPPNGGRKNGVALANRWNRIRYGVYAPIYSVVAKPLERGRERAIERLDIQSDDRVLILGCGPGVDLEYLPAEASITAIDITPSMVRRTERRAAELGMDVDARVGDAQDLPYDHDVFDVVLLHLVLSVVPEPDAVAAEAARVLAEDGRMSIYDKFVPEGTTPSLLRRAINPLATVLFSDLTRQLEPILEGTDLVLGPRESFLGGLYTVTIARPDPGLG